MKKSVFSLSIIAASLLLTCSCEKKTDVTPTKPAKYVLLSSVLSGNNTGYFTSYDQIPSGTISNITSKSRQTVATTGIRQVGKYLFHMSNFAGEAGVHKVSVGDDGAQ